MPKTTIFVTLLGISLALVPQVFRGSFLQIDDDFTDEWEEKAGPLVDPPAGHGLPEFSKAPYELTPEEMFVEYYEWQQLEAAAESEFYAQTDAAIADARADYDECETKYTTEEEIATCQEKALKDEEEVIRAVEDLQSSHAQEEELVEAAMVFLVEEYYATHELDSEVFDDVVDIQAEKEILGEEQIDSNEEVTPSEEENQEAETNAETSI